MIRRRIAEMLSVQGMKPQFTGPIDDVPEEPLKHEKSYTTYSFSHVWLRARQVRVRHGCQVMFAVTPSPGSGMVKFII